MDTNKTDNLSSAWKWLAILLIGVLVGMFLAESVLAYDPLKWQICDGLNISGGACDDFWFQLKGQVEGNNSLGDYYNKTQVESLIASLSGTYYNKTELDSKISGINTSSGTTPTDALTKGEFIAFRDNLSSSYVTRNEYLFGNSAQTKSDEIPTSYLLLGGAAFFLIVMFMFKDKIFPEKKKDPAYLNAAPAQLEAMEAVKKLNRLANKEGEQPPA